MALYRSTIIPEMNTELVHDFLARDEAGSPPPCTTGNEYDGRMGLRISSIFVILVGSIFGAVFPVVAARFGGSRIPSWVFLSLNTSGLVLLLLPPLFTSLVQLRRL
jgi:hypothetical protein